MFFRGDPAVVAQFEAYLIEHRQINLSMLTYYEILSGLKHRDARKQLTLFLNLLPRILFCRLRSSQSLSLLTFMQLYGATELLSMTLTC